MAHVTTTLLCTLCLAYAGLNVYAALQSNALIFLAPPSSYADTASILKLKTSDGEIISAYYLPGLNSQRLLLYSQGNGEDIGMARSFLEVFQKQGISVLAYDYPGYGTSTGKPSERGCYRAIEAAHTHATENLGYESSDIILYGRSLGSGPSCWLAEKETVAGLILDGAFTSIFRVVTGINILPWDKFDNYARLPNIESPVLVIHGTEDRVIPFAHAESNYKRISGDKKKLIVTGAGHNNLIEEAGSEYWRSVLTFINGETP